MLVELGVVEQRLQAVLEVINDGATVVDVARRHGVSRQTVYVWLRRYASDGLPGLVDGSAKPLSCPHQMPPEVEARIVELRREQPTPARPMQNNRALPGNGSLRTCTSKAKQVWPPPASHLARPLRPATHPGTGALLRLNRTSGQLRITRSASLLG